MSNYASSIKATAVAVTNNKPKMDDESEDWTSRFILFTGGDDDDTNATDDDRVPGMISCCVEEHLTAHIH
jgi:hypothetical protein